MLNIFGVVIFLRTGWTVVSPQYHLLREEESGYSEPKDAILDFSQFTKT